jgi:hypothetical protein
MGPISPFSNDGKNYVMTVLGDYSKLASVVTKKTKDEAPAYLIHICNQIENQTDLTIKAIRSDNGGKYINAADLQFTSNKGIDPQHFAPYMPHSNGSSENLNFKLQARVTAVIQEAKMNKNVRSEAIKTAAYVRNGFPHYTTPGNQTPMASSRRLSPL